MIIERKELIHHIQSAKGFDLKNAINLILVASEMKNACFVPLKINNNYEDKSQFINHIEKCKMIYEVGRAKGYEEIDLVTGNKIIWKFKGIWYGYDIFNSTQEWIDFKEYKKSLQKQKHEETDKIAGEIYSYPKCCVENFIIEQDLNYLKKKYTLYTFYSKLHKMDRLFPFVFHRPCSVKCAKTKKLNEMYKNAIKKYAKKIFEEYTAKKRYSIPVIFGSESDIFKDNINKEGSIWPKKDGHEYLLITQMPINSKHSLIPYATKKIFKKGDVYEAEITISHNYADVDFKRKKEIIKGLHYERKILTG